MARTSRDEPADGGAETREETLERVVAEQAEIRDTTPEAVKADPSTRRGFSRRVLGLQVTFALIGYVLVAASVWAIDGRWWVGLFSGFAGIVIGATIPVLFFAEREDGRVSDRVDGYTPETRAPDQNAGD